MSKICLYCRKEVEDTSVLCPNCGQKIESNVTNVESQTVNNNATGKTISNNANINEQVNTNEPKKDKNVIATIGFVLAIISPLCCCGTSWLGLIFSIIGLVESKKKNGVGKKLAIAGIIISTILLVLLVVIYVLNAFSLFTTELKGINTGRYY